MKVLTSIKSGHTVVLRPATLASFLYERRPSALSEVKTFIDTDARVTDELGRAAVVGRPSLPIETRSKAEVIVELAID